MQREVPVDELTPGTSPGWLAHSWRVQLRISGESRIRDFQRRRALYE
jgi:hypothetical protein